MKMVTEITELIQLYNEVPSFTQELIRCVYAEGKDDELMEILNKDKKLRGYPDGCDIRTWFMENQDFVVKALKLHTEPYVYEEDGE